MSALSALFPIGGTLTGCIGCMYFVELLANEQPGCMHLMTFATFLFISIEGFIFTSKFMTVENKIPIRGYIRLVVVFFGVNVLNNQVLNYHIPVPLHIIFRSGSLLASLLLGRILLRRTYSIRKYLSIILITLGIIMCTMASTAIEKKIDEKLSIENANKHKIEYMIGVSMLVVALLASAYLGICQERLYSAYGKHSREAMFYVHALSLPGFALFWSDISTYVMIFNESAPMQLVGSIAAPRLWVVLLITCVLQYVCIRFVYRLTSEMPSLTVTLVVTLRKFLSLIISIYCFNNPFTPMHWFGSALVFAGTLAFADIWQMPTTKTKQQ